MSKKINIGILGCADIAFKRFIPAANNIESVEVKLIAEEYDKTKLDIFCNRYKLESVESFDEIIKCDNIDAVYIPQPPALHYEWAKKALLNGKHILLEKPSTISYNLTEELIELARSKKLALHENYMFAYHNQLKEILALLKSGTIGDIRLIRANFGFPLRAASDFRYNAKLGGGALLDAGGYAVKLASILLGESVQVDTACLNYLEGYEVDMYGSASLSNDLGQVCQIAFGMDCYYQCNVDICGSKGRLYTNRIFTAPPDYAPIIQIETNAGKQELVLNCDSHFEHSIECFYEEIFDKNKREKMYREILLQSELVEQIKQYH